MLKTLFALVFFATLGAAGYAAWYAATPVAVASLPVEFELPPGTRLAFDPPQPEAAPADAAAPPSGETRR